VTRFRWNDWNLDSATKHGCTVEEIEEVVRRETRARRARQNRNDTVRVEGRGVGRVVEVVFVIDDKDEAWGDDVFYVIHAMPLTTRRRRGT
jgi:hypothetical protein